MSVAPLFPYETWARHKPKRLAEKLRQIREALGLSQQEMAERLAERAGFKKLPKTSRSMNGYRSIPFIEIVLVYSRLSDLSMNDIVDDDLI